MTQAKSCFYYFFCRKLQINYFCTNTKSYEAHVLFPKHEKKNERKPQENNKKKMKENLRKLIKKIPREKQTLNQPKLN